MSLQYMSRKWEVTDNPWVVTTGTGPHIVHVEALKMYCLILYDQALAH